MREAGADVDEDAEEDEKAVATMEEAAAEAEAEDQMPPAREETRRASGVTPMA